MSEERKSILQEADELINGDRLRDYGNPRIVFNKLSSSFSCLTGVDIDKDDAILFLVLLKLVRFRNSGFTHRDSLVDAAGYLGLFEKVHLKELIRKPCE